MNIFTPTIVKKMALTAAACAALFANTNAATFTAVASGNFTAAATWGGVAPSTTISGDNIIIPAGVNVTLNQNVSISGPTSSLTVVGSLQSATNEDLAITGGALFAGSGDLIIDSLTLGSLTSSLTFTGDILVRALTSTGISLTTGAEIDVLEKITLSTGVTNLTNATVSLMDEGRLYMAGGTLSVGLSTVLDFNLYDVVYTDVSATTGLELTGSGLRNIYVSVPSGSSVTLGADLMVTDTLHMVSGTLALNGNDLTFGGDGNVAAGGSAEINASNTSDISIMSNNSFIGSLRFAPAGSTVNNLTVDMGSSSATANIGSDLNVAGTLSLQSGRLDVGSNNLTVATGGSISGGSANSFVVTGTGGRLSMNVGAGTTGNFMVGTASNFSPMVVVGNTGSANSTISVNVMKGVWSNGTSGTNLATTQSVVDATWNVTSSVTSGLNLNLQASWSTGMEVNGFDRTDAYISHYMNSQWDASTKGAAASGSAGMYNLTRAGITSLSPFAVADGDAKLTSIADVAKYEKFNVYPNPVVNTLKIDMNVGNTPAQAVIFDLAGHAVKTTTVINNEINVSELAPGFYTIRLAVEGVNAVGKFMKQ